MFPLAQRELVEKRKKRVMLVLVWWLMEKEKSKLNEECEEGRWRKRERDWSVVIWKGM